MTATGVSTWTRTRSTGCGSPSAASRALVDRQVAGDGMTRTQLSVLGTVARLQSARHRRAGRHRGPQPDHAVAAHRQARGRPDWSRRSPGADDRARRWSSRSPRPAAALHQRLRRERTALFEERLGRLPAGAGRGACSPRPGARALWPSTCGARDRRPRPPDGQRPRRPAHDRGLRIGTRHVRLAVEPQLPPLLHRPGRVARRHVDAVGRAVLAGAAADRLGHRARPRRRAADAAGAAARALRRRRRRPGRQAQADDRPAGDDGRAGARARPAHVTHVVTLWQVYVLAFLLGHEQLLREPGPAGVRARDGRRRPTCATR